MLAMEIMLLLLLVGAEHKCFIRAIKYADRYVTSRTNVALDNGPAIHVTTKRPVGAGYYARPTTDTLLCINDNLVTPELFVHRAGETRVNTPGLIAVATLDRKGNLYVSLHMYARQRTRSLSSKRFDWVLRLRVLYKAIDFAQSTAHADLFFDIYSSHAVNSSSRVLT
jgi:hypothetical protein